MAHAIRSEQDQSNVRALATRKLTVVKGGKATKLVAELKLNPRAKIPCHRLPFVGRSTPKGEFSFWNVPMTGGYGGGCDAGGWLAMFMLIHLREQSQSDMAIPLLGQVASSWLEAARTASDEEFDALQGQAIGFMTRLSPWLMLAAREAGRNLDRVNQKEVLLKANAGLAVSINGEIAQ
ncbi:hypothetical protein [Pseudomonas chlororaphis]|uniref:hypothetical protein n=1 Tax=Pseudomonas chlororaphis TaxID=587753 RepID=UPI0015DE4F8B|nr:hypothetical protein [Pseudomonas chlororaphis]QLL15475.1 hypothetical protein H0I86_10450 [Pseudomonas chlororaphis subsp. aurantiaca]